MARGGPGAALAPLLGQEGWARLQEVLLARALRWAASTALAVHVALDEDENAHLRAVVGERATVFAQRGEDTLQRVAHACAVVAGQRGGPILLVGTAVPALGTAHATAALGDLRGGCDVSLGPTASGGCYLLAVADAASLATGTPQAALAAPTLLGQALAIFAQAGLTIGLLRSERELLTPADARAALADPLCPVDVAEVLRSYAQRS